MTVKETPAVTVIIATYNKRSTLFYAIKSVLWQTFTDFECWIIGDACTDGSETVVAGFRDPRLHWYNLPVNSGYQSIPTNEALKRARGTFIAYLNHDDIWLPDHLQILMDGIEQKETDFVYSIMEWIGDDSRYADIPQYPDAPRPPEVPAILHRRDVVEDIGYWKEPHEIRADPRVEFLRSAQFSGKSFELIPYLTVLKFDRRVDDYGASSQQGMYMERIGKDPLFAEKELGSLLADAYRQLEGPLSMKRVRFQFMQSIRKMMVKRRIDPGCLKPWLKPGSRIAYWRRGHGLDSNNQDR